MPPRSAAAAVIDTAIAYFPYPILISAQKRYAHGLSFWRGEAQRACHGVFCNFEISRIDNQGILQKPLNNTSPKTQNNINYLTLSRATAAAEMISAAYKSALTPADGVAVEKWGKAAAGRWVRLDVAFDLSPNSTPTLRDIRRYLYHGRGAGARTLQVASPDGVYMYDKRCNVWRLKDYGACTTQIAAVPDFFASHKALCWAIKSGAITLYIGTQNAKIAIYHKCGKIRHEVRLKKSPLKKALPGRDIASLANYSHARHLLHSAAARLSELYGNRPGVNKQLHGATYRSLCTYRPAGLLRANIRRYFHFRGEWSRPNYNNVTLSLPVPVLHPPRPPPYRLIQLNNRSSSQPVHLSVLLLLHGNTCKPIPTPCNLAQIPSFFRVFLANSD